MIAELARLGAATAGAADKVWWLERLHADALLLPLAYLVRHGCSWDLLGEAFRYNKREFKPDCRQRLSTILVFVGLWFACCNVVDKIALLPCMLLINGKVLVTV